MKQQEGVCCGRLGGGGEVPPIGKYPNKNYVMLPNSRLGSSQFPHLARIREWANVGQIGPVSQGLEPRLCPKHDLHFLRNSTPQSKPSTLQLKMLNRLNRGMQRLLINLAVISVVSVPSRHRSRSSRRRPEMKKDMKGRKTTCNIRISRPRLSDFPTLPVTRRLPCRRSRDWNKVTCGLGAPNA